MNPMRLRSALLPLLIVPVVLAGASAAGDVSTAVRNAERLRLAGDGARAAEAMGSLLGERPGEIAAMEVRVHALLDSGRWREALVSAREYESANPDDPRVLSLMAEALFRAGSFEEAEKRLVGIAELETPPARGLMTLGRLRAARGRNGEASECLRRAVEIAPDDREILYRSASATATRAEAVEVLEHYLELSEGDDAETIAAAEGHLALFRALGERSIWVSRRRPERVELPLKQLWIPESGTTIGYAIQARIGEKGKPVWLLLDSGSPGLYVIDRLARKRGFSRMAELTVFGGGGVGRHATQRGFFSVVRFGELEFTDALASASAQEIDPQGRFHGLVGLSVFNGYRVTLDLRRKRMILEQGGDSLPGTDYFTVGGQMLVRAETSGNREGMFLFDTGSTHTLVADSLLEGVERAEGGAEVEVHAYGGLRRGTRALRGVTVFFQGRNTGERELRSVDLSLRSQVGGVEVSGFLGLDLLDRTRVEIDTVARTVRVIE